MRRVSQAASKSASFQSEMARHNVKAGTAGFVATSFNGSEDHVNFLECQVQAASPFAGQRVLDRGLPRRSSRVLVD